jgi:hypothetical protein
MIRPSAGKDLGAASGAPDFCLPWVVRYEPRLDAARVPDTIGTLADGRQAKPLALKALFSPLGAEN